MKKSRNQNLAERFVETRNYPNTLAKYCVEIVKAAIPLKSPETQMAYALFLFIERQILGVGHLGCEETAQAGYSYLCSTPEVCEAVKNRIGKTRPSTLNKYLRAVKELSPEAEK